MAGAIGYGVPICLYSAAHPAVLCASSKVSVSAETEEKE